MTTATEPRRLLPFSEQRPAVAALEELLSPVRHDDAAWLVVLHGPAGSGKSFLVERTLEDAAFDTVDAEAFRPERSTRQNDGLIAASADPEILVIENLQHLPLGSAGTLVQILDDRQTRGRATIITASAGPRHLRYRGEPYPTRLTSRLAAGLVVSVPLPTANSCRAALESFLRDAGLNVPQGVIEHLVRTHRSLRALEGAVNQLTLLSKLDAKLQTAPLVDHFQKQAPAEKVVVERIVQRVAKCFQVTPKDVRSRSRQRGIVVPRHVSMYLVRQLTPLSFQQIAAYFGDCDHGTVLHACRKMEKTLAADPALGGTVRQLQSDLA